MKTKTTNNKMKPKSIKEADNTAVAKVDKSKKYPTAKVKKSHKKESIKKSAKKKVSKKKADSVKKKAVSKKKKIESNTETTVEAKVNIPKMQPINKVTKLKVWMMEHGVNQKELAKKTSLSTNTINRLVNNGHATKSVVKLVSYELGISVEQIMELLKFNEPVNS